MGRAVYGALMAKFNLDSAKIYKRLTGILHDSQRSSRLQGSSRFQRLELGGRFYKHTEALNNIYQLMHIYI
jgi:hypothetical protein